MEILTKYGSIDYDDLEDFELSKETMDYIERQKSAAEIFFANEIDLTEADDEFSDNIKEVAEVAIAENKYEYPARAFAISEYTDEPLTNIDEETYDTQTFDVAGSMYMVLTDDEADEKALDYAKGLIDDIGIEGFSEDAKEFIYSECVETEWFDEAMQEYNANYVIDIKDDSSSNQDIYVNRLHEEMVEKEIMDEPEWPDEDDFTHEREEFDEPEPDADDFESDDAYSISFDMWEQAEKDFEEEQDRLEEEATENFENATEDFRTDLESEIEDHIDEFVEALNGDYENGLDYYKQNYGEEEVARIADENNLIDKDEVAKYLVQTDDRGGMLSSYDGSEDSISITYKGENHEYFIYHTA